MNRRGKALTMMASVATGLLLAMGLMAGSGTAPVPAPAPVVRSALPVGDQVDIYAAILANLAGAGPSWATRRQPIVVSRTIFDTCPLPHSRPGVRPCGREKVGRLTPEIEKSLREALRQIDVDAVFVDDQDSEPPDEVYVSNPDAIRREVYSVHEIVFDSAGVLAADGDVQRSQGDRFRFSRIDGRWRLKNSTLLWIA